MDDWYTPKKYSKDEPVYYLGLGPMPYPGSVGIVLKDSEEFNPFSFTEPAVRVRVLWQKPPCVREVAWWNLEKINLK